MLSFQASAASRMIEAASLCPVSSAMSAAASSAEISAARVNGEYPASSSQRSCCVTGPLRKIKPAALQLAQILRGLAAQQIEQQNGERGLVHLDATPVRTPIEPQVLRPVARRLLCDLEIAKHSDGVCHRASSQQSASGLYQVARPDQVITAQILVAFVESPGDGEAGDDAAEKILGLMRAQNGSRGAIEIVLAFWVVKIEQSVLPVLPMDHVMLAQVVILLEQAGTRLLPGLAPNATEAEGQDEFSAARREVD